MTQVSLLRDSARNWEPELNDRLWNWTHDLVNLSGVGNAIPTLMDHLNTLWLALPASEWERVVAFCRAHPIRGAIHQDPFTKWSFDRPRGYAGDATLLDFIYLRPQLLAALPEISETGMAIYAASRMAPAAKAVRHRRNLLASYIDDTCWSKPNARIMSVACGHLREAEISTGVAAGRFETFLALDQDQVSLNTVEQAHQGRNIRAVNCSVRSLLAGKLGESSFDLIYAAGLYDYLVDRVATRLTETLFEKLRPGGRLVIANFLNTCPNVGYMDVFMDWRLILRTPEDFRALVGQSVEDNSSDIRSFCDDTNSVVYLEITK